MPTDVQLNDTQKAKIASEAKLHVSHYGDYAYTKQDISDSDLMHLIRSSGMRLALSLHAAYAEAIGQEMNETNIDEESLIDDPFFKAVSHEFDAAVINAQRAFNAEPHDTAYTSLANLVDVL